MRSLYEMSEKVTTDHFGESSDFIKHPFLKDMLRGEIHECQSPYSHFLVM